MLLQLLKFILFAVTIKVAAGLSIWASANGPQNILYDLPVSNNGARCRIILYKKCIPKSSVKIESPMELGGLRSPEYLRINPQGKMPVLCCADSGLNIAESDTISRYLISNYPEGPSFQPENPLSNLISRIHDMYLTTIQSCMYKAGPFGRFGTRSEALDEYVKQLNVIEDLINIDGGIYLCGKEVSLADATVYPSAVFASQMLPKFGVHPALPPKLEKWYTDMKASDEAFRKVHDEIMGGLESWEEKDRWRPLLGAGWRDDAPATLFDKLLSGEIPADVVLEDDYIFAFKDINPAAPAHVLVIPKRREGLTRLRQANAEHTEILGKLLIAAADISQNESLGFGDGARVVINDGPDAGQEVPHLHVHVIGGRSMQWPPG